MVTFITYIGFVVVSVGFTVLLIGQVTGSHELDEHECPKCGERVHWVDYPEWSGRWVHTETDMVPCEKKGKP